MKVQNLSTLSISIADIRREISMWKDLVKTPIDGHVYNETCKAEMLEETNLDDLQRLSNECKAFNERIRLAIEKSIADDTFDLTTHIDELDVDKDLVDATSCEESLHSDNSFGSDENSFEETSYEESENGSTDLSFAEADSPVSSEIESFDIIFQEALDSDVGSTNEETVLQDIIDEDEMRRLHFCQDLVQIHTERNDLLQEEIPGMLDMMLEIEKSLSYGLDEDQLAACQEAEDDDIHDLLSNLEDDEFKDAFQDMYQAFQHIKDVFLETDINVYNGLTTKTGPNCLMYEYRGVWMPFLAFHSAMSQESGGGDTNFQVLHPAYNASPSPSPEPFSDDEYY